MKPINDWHKLYLEVYKENQKLKDINKQLMKEIQWENRLNSKLSKELSDLKELILKTINIFEIALELKEVKSK